MSQFLIGLVLGLLGGGAVVYIYHTVIMSKVGAVTTAVQDAKKVI
jgi:hypothetical protein